MRNPNHGLNIYEIENTAPFTTVLANKYLIETGLKNIPDFKRQFELTSPFPLIKIELLFVLENMTSIAS